MKVNSLKFPNSKRHHSYFIHQQNKFPNLNIVELQEPINDYCRPINIFNSQLSLKGLNDQSKYQQVEIKESSSKNNEDIIINNKLEEHIVDQPMGFPFKNSSINTKDKISSEFTNADSKSNYSKEISPTGSESHIQNQDSTLLSILMSNNESKGSKNQKSCNCPHRHSMGLNTKELIKITLQRKLMLNQLEEKAKERRKSNDLIDNSDQIEYNTNDKDNENELVNVNFEDNVEFSSIQSNYQIFHNKNTKGDQMNFNYHQSRDSDFKVDKERFNKNNDEDFRNIEFKIENRSDEDNRNNSYHEEEYLFSQNENEPYKVTHTTQKEMETEINELDIEKNKNQNETKIMFNNGDSSSQMTNNSLSWLNPLSPTNNQSSFIKNADINIQSNDLSQFNCFQPQLIQQEKDSVSLQKINYFEDTLKKIHLNEDKVINYDTNASKKIIDTHNKQITNTKQCNNRYDNKIAKRETVIPHPITKVSTNNNTHYSDNKNLNKKQLAVIKVNNDDDASHKLQKSKMNSESKNSNSNQSSKKKRYSNNYSELYNKKSINASGAFIQPKPINKSSSTKVMSKSNSGCDILQSNNYLYSKQKYINKTNHSTRNQEERLIHYETSDALE